MLWAILSLSHKAHKAFPRLDVLLLCRSLGLVLLGLSLLSLLSLSFPTRPFHSPGATSRRLRTHPLKAPTQATLAAQAQLGWEPVRHSTSPSPQRQGTSE